MRILHERILHESASTSIRIRRTTDRARAGFLTYVERKKENVRRGLT